MALFEPKKLAQFEPKQLALTEPKWVALFGASYPGIKKKAEIPTVPTVVRFLTKLPEVL